MDDKKIIEMFLARDENAIRAVEKKYGGLCYHVASNILASHEDREECVNDVLLALWNAIEKAENWKSNSWLVTVNCTDGVLKFTGK